MKSNPDKSDSTSKQPPSSSQAEISSVAGDSDPKKDLNPTSKSDKPPTSSDPTTKPKTSKTPGKHNGRRKTTEGRGGLGDDDGEFEVEDPGEKIYSGGLFNLQSSPAYKALEGLRQNGDVPEAKITSLMDKLTSLFTCLTTTVEAEKSLAKRCKQLTQEISGQKIDIDRTANLTFSSNSDIGDLKRELLKAENELTLAQQREKRVHDEIEECQKQRQGLTNDIEEIRRHKADMLEPQLIASTKELKALIQRKHQVENLQKDLEEKQTTLDKIKSDKERLEIEKEKQAVALAKSTEIPLKIIKQTEVLRDAISALVLENMKQTTMGQQLDKELERLAKRRKELEEHKLDQAADYEQRRAEIHEMERQCDEIFKKHEMSKELLGTQKAERVKLDLMFKKILSDSKREHDVLLRAIRDKEIQLKIFRRLNTTVNNIKMAIPEVRKQFDELQQQRIQYHREGQSHRKQIIQLRKSIDMTVYDFLKQEQLEKHEVERLQLQINQNRALEDELQRITAQCSDLSKQIETMSGERELKSRELIRIQTKCRTIKEDLSVKDIAISDSRKRCEESATRLKEFATLYDVVKNERNKYLNQIQATQQRAAEFKEKIKILSNEKEILRHEITNKERELGRKRQENVASYALRDSAKNDANKLLATYRDRRDQIEQYLSRIETLNTHINAAEDDMLALKHRFEQAIRDRNSAGIHVLDRNDELCILYEKLNIQSAVMVKGEGELALREEEIRELKLTLSELDRGTELLKRQMPQVDEYDRELVSVQKELDEVRETVAKLSADIESPDDPSRCRKLAGVDPGQKELLEKIKMLEELLCEKEERLLEKDLILEEVTTLTERLRKQTLEGRTETNDTAIKLNDLTKRIKHATRGLMAKVSELSMQQALAMTLYQERMAKEALISEAQERLDRGEPPTDSIEQEFIRAERTRMRRERALMDMRSKRAREANGLVDIDEDGFHVLNGTRTIAEPRPNAYIPDASGVGELPIPKPYGSYAPFRPTELGSQMRHFRKPVIKPIVI
ncbi:hypothetical protein BJ742DRAFT_772272 [Cladochytrium replicatum]|nr:hypothetical protein BJ742DRAFT_772272 [Cladochytrium replicatum]